MIQIDSKLNTYYCVFPSLQYYAFRVRWSVTVHINTKLERNTYIRLLGNISKISLGYLFCQNLKIRAMTRPDGRCPKLFTVLIYMVIMRDYVKYIGSDDRNTI
jgi:hypothetical protein